MKDKYALTRIWGVLDDPGQLKEGMVVQVVTPGDGANWHQVLNTMPYVTKKGKVLEFGTISEPLT